MKISILQWNIWCNEDVRNIAGFLRQNKTDIICLQEMAINYPKQAIKHAPDYLAKELGCNYYYQELPIESISGGKLMLANGVFSRFPILAKRYYWTNNPAEAGGCSNEKRVYVEIGLAVAGKILKVGTTHMSYTHKFEVNSQKQKETNRLVDFIVKNKRRFIITGDMNAQPGSYTIKKLESVFNNLGPSYDYKTWTTKPFSYNGFEANTLGWRLDHIFGTKDIKLIKSEVIQTDYSDHLPIKSIIEI